MSKIKDISPKDIKIIPAKEKIETLDPTQDIGAVVGGLGGRLASTIKEAINAEGNFVNDVINQQLDTHAKQILGNFTFGASGAITIQTDADNGLWISPTGILGKKAGENTFAIGIDGTATFAGTLSGASGTFGTITAGTITGVDVFAQQFRNLRWTVQYGLNTTDGWETVASGGATLTPYASNLMLLDALDSLGADATASIQVGSYGIDLTISSTAPLTLSKSPMLEATAICTALSGDGTAWLRMGQITDSTSAYIGWRFLPSSTIAQYHDGSAGYSVNLTNAIDNTKWHKYRIQVTPNGSNFDVKWYVDDVLEATVSNHTFTGTSGKNFGARVSNNWAAGGAEDSAVMVVGSVIFQQDY